MSLSKQSVSKERNKMMNLNSKFMDRMFKSVENVVWDMMTGRVGFNTPDGIASIELGALDPANPNEAPEAQITVNMFEDFGMAVPAFAQSVPVDSITMGDMIYSSSAGKVVGWVVKRSDSGKSFKIMKQDGMRSDWVPPKTSMIGFESGVMVLRSLLNMLPGGSAGLGGMQGNIMQMMMMQQMMQQMMGGDESSLDMKAMMPMMLMQQMATPTGAPAAAGSNPMAAMMPMMMMMGMAKGGKGGKGGSGFFNG